MAYAPFLSIPEWVKVLQTIEGSQGMERVENAIRKYLVETKAEIDEASV